ncbi:hypothetical protein BJ138DRAFT_1223846, partial [Hygrophoropsis aurantiaca]
MQSTEEQMEFSLTVLGATGLSPSDDNHPMSFYVIVEVDGKQERTAELAPSPQSTIEWDTCFLLKVDKASHVSLCLHECWTTAHDLRGDKAIWETRVTAEQLLGNNSKVTYMTLPAKAPHGEGHVIVNIEQAAEAEHSVVDERHHAEDLEQAVDYNCALLHLHPSGDPDHCISLINLACTLFTRFNQFGDRADLDKAIELNHAASALCPPGHPNHSMSLSNLASTLCVQFNQFALVLHPPGHPDRSISLGNLALTLSTQFDHFGDKDDLDKAIELNRAALALCPSGHPDHSTSLNNLARTLSTRFDQFGDRDDLDKAIELNHVALALRSPGHPNHSISLGNLALTLSTRFNQFGDRDDLNKAIDLNHAALALRPPGHPDRFISLSNLARSLCTRFNQFGDRADLEKAIELNCSGLTLCPPGHPDRSTSLSRLAHTLSIRFNQFGDRANLDKAIELNQAALALCSPGHTGHSMLLINLAFTLCTRFDQFGDRADLDKAIELNHAALALCSPGHTDHSTSLGNLAHTLFTRFNQFGDRADLDKAIELNHAALALRPPGHPGRFISLNNLALTLSTQFAQSGNRADLDIAMQHHKSASTATNCGSWPRFQSSLEWVEAAERFNHISVLNAYKVSLGNLDRHAISRSSIVLRHELLKSSYSSLAANAASCALRQHEPRTAVELLEQGRGVLWTQMANLHTPLEHLRGVNALGERLAIDLQRISSQLNKLSGSMQDDKISSHDAKAQYHRQLAEEWDSVVSQARQVEGFSRFLLPPLYSDLQEAAANGPIVVINASEYSCDAIIILLNGAPCHVPLPDITLDDVSDLLLILTYALSESQDQLQIVSLLRDLWKLVMLPIVHALEKTQVAPGSRIWLCPTSMFISLPLHAAGPYQKDKQGLSDLYIISYTPTLSALIRTRNNKVASPTIPKFAVIGQPTPSGGSEHKLPSVNAELDLVLELLPPSVPSSRLSDTEATNSAALATLHEHSWVHIACHG